MKTEFFKNMMPFAVAALGIAGAFTTTSMQRASADKPFLTAYAYNSSGDCNIPVEGCNEVQGKICRVNGDTGAQAFFKDEDGDCNQLAYRPQNP